MEKVIIAKQRQKPVSEGCQSKRCETQQQITISDLYRSCRRNRYKYLRRENSWVYCGRDENDYVATRTRDDREIVDNRVKDDESYAVVEMDHSVNTFVFDISRLVRFTDNDDIDDEDDNVDDWERIHRRSSCFSERSCNSSEGKQNSSVCMHDCGRREGSRSTASTVSLNNTCALDSPDLAEELLEDVLHSVYSLMGASGSGEWEVTTGHVKESSQKNSILVTLDQVTQDLQSAFQVTPDTLDRLTQQAKDRTVPNFHLHLTVKEAKNLRPKTVKGKTNAFATVVCKSNGPTCSTRVAKNTVSPTWNQDYILSVKNIQEDNVEIQVWHQHDFVGVQQMTAVRDIKSLGRLMKDTCAQAQHNNVHLLGQVNLNVKDISKQGMEQWYNLRKDDGDVTKDRGSILLRTHISSTSPHQDKGQRSYNALLMRLILHHLTTTSNNSQQEDVLLPPWNGCLSSSSSAVLAQHAIMIGLSDTLQQLSWWCVGTMMKSVDAEWTLSQLRCVQEALEKGYYQGDDLRRLQSSFACYVWDQAERLKDLHTAFPPSSGVLAQHELTYVLKVLQSLQDHAASRRLLDSEGLPQIHEVVTSSLTLHAKKWWKTLVEEQLSEVRTVSKQISRVDCIVNESRDFLIHVADFYDGIFTTEMSIPYMQTTYLMVSKKVNACVRPFLMNIYKQMPGLSDQLDITDVAVQFALEIGTSLWQLYRSLGLLHMLWEGLPPEACEESGMKEYHSWFSQAATRWLENLICGALYKIKKAVDNDTFEPLNSVCKFSASAANTTRIFHDIKTWWLKLDWPDPEKSHVLLTKILEDVFSCGATYYDLLRGKVSTMVQRPENTKDVCLTQKVCVGLNNIERVKQELMSLPEHFGLNDLLTKVKETESGHETALELSSEVERLIQKASDTMESKVNEFIDAVIDKMRPTLERGICEACDLQSKENLFNHILNPTLQLLCNELSESTFQSFLWRIWEVIITLFKIVISKNAERRERIYFNGVLTILEATLTIFSPDGGYGLDSTAAKTTEYTELKQLLENLRMTSEMLIAKYYQERYDEEHINARLPSKAQLVVTAYFTRSGKLFVDVLMAQNIVRPEEVVLPGLCSGGLLSQHYSQQSYVKVQLVPQEWFPNAAVFRTKTISKDPAVYDERFQFDINKDDDGVRAGHLLLTLKDYNYTLGYSNTFIGEVVVPLTTLPCVDSSEVHTVTNTYLKMTLPKFEMGYKSLKALRYRTGDRIASAFLRKEEISKIRNK